MPIGSGDDAEGRVEGLQDPRARQGGGDLCCRGAVCGYHQGVEGGEVQRVGDVDDDLAGQLVATRGEDVGDGGVGDGEDGHVTGGGRVCVAVSEQLDGAAACGDDAGDGMAHGAGSDDADVRHDVFL